MKATPRDKGSSHGEGDWLLRVSVLAIILLAFAARVYRIFDLPPGLTGDEAYNLMDIRRILGGGYLPLYFEGNNGREPLFIYLQAPLVAILGPVPYALRLTSALVGTLTVAVTYRWARDLLGGGERPGGRWAPAVASFLLASSLWHVNQSRIGLRAILLPLLAGVTFILFWRGYSKGERRYFLASGVSLGLSLYTYTAGRLLPLVLVFFLLSRRLWVRAPARGIWVGAALVGAGMAVVTAPLALYAIAHTRLFWDRSIEVSTLNVHAPPVWETVLRTLGMFVWSGGQVSFLSPGGRSVFDWPMGLVFFLGVGLSLAVLGCGRSGRPGPAWLPYLRPEACLFPLLWLVIMLIPSFFSTPAPHFLRALGAIPAVYIFPALAIAVLGSRLSGLSSNLGRRLGTLALVLLTLFSGLNNLGEYFRWTSSSRAYYPFSADMLDIGRYIRERSGDTYVYGDQPLMADNTVQAMTVGTTAVSFDARWAVVFPPGPAEYLMLASDAQQRQFGRYLPSEVEPFVWKDGLGKGVLVGYRVDGLAARIYNRAVPSAPLYGAHHLPRQPDRAGEATIGGEIALKGYGVASGDVSGPGPTAVIRSGQPFRVILAWEALRRPYSSYQVSVKAFDGAGKVWAQRDASPGQNSYPTTVWRAGEWVYDIYPLILDAGAPPGRYYLEVTVYDLDTLRIFPVLAADGQPLGQHYLLGDIQVEG